ncbi:MAG: beta-galactosidase GalB [Marinilabilia sp.]
MRRFFSFPLLAVFFLIISCTQPEKEEAREVRLFNNNWAFSMADSAGSYQSPGFDDSQWRTLELPHDWSIEGEFSPDHPAGIGGGALPGGIGWYRKSFKLEESAKDKRVFIDFDGVYMNSEVWINGHHLGKRPNGYISFRYDLTPYLNYGEKENVIAVKVDNSKQPNSRWYSGSGIYRNVWLTRVNPLYVDQWGTFVRTSKITGDRAYLDIEHTISNQLDRDTSFHLMTEIFTPGGERIASTGMSDVRIKSKGEETIDLSAEVAGPQLWSIDKPQLYRAVTTVLIGEEKLDEYETEFGIRNFHFDSDKGFFLNGESVKLKGVCLHHDQGALGAALNRRAKERQLEIMKDMGVNAIRTAHNPPAPELLELCDSMGFIVMNETFDEWKESKVEYGYSMYWDEWHEQDLRDHIRRDRNHPSVMIWSIGNEIPEQWDSVGTTMTRELAGIVRELDDTRPITTGNNGPTPDNSLIQSGELDLIGYNYHHQDYADFPETFPGEKFIATETNSALGTRGSYDMPSDSIRVWPYKWDEPFHDGNPDHSCSAYDNCHTPWGSTHTATWKEIKNHDFMSGMFIWTGFDYLGEPTPYEWPSRSSYFGVVDLAGFPKDAYYFYKSEWTQDTVLHVFPHWNWEKGDTVDVWSYYNNADEVELFLNGKSLGTKGKPENKFHVQWRVPYQPGAIRAVSLKDEDVVATKEIRTAGEPALLKMDVDRNQIKADGKDLAYVSVSVTDKNGNLVPRADNLVKFSLDGEASIVATDNGDQTSHASFQSHQRKTFHGKCLAIVKAGEEPGQIVVKASAEGLPDGVVRIQTK